MELTNIDITKKKGEMTITFDVPVNAIESCYGKALGRISSAVQLPGFRKGKAPRGAVEKNYGDRIMSMAEDMVIGDAVDAVFTNEKVKGADILNSPRLRRITEFKRDEPFRLETIVTISPEFELGEYKGIKLTRKKTEVPDAERDEELNRLAERQAMFASVDRPAGDGDFVLINCRSLDDSGEAVAEFTMENGKFVIGMTKYPDEFQKNIVGMSAGESRDFSVAVPDDYHVEKLRGLRASVSLELLAVKERKLPDIDDEFAVSHGYKGLEDLKKAVDDFLAERAAREASDQLCADLFEELRKRNPIEELPESLLEEERQRRKAGFEAMIESMGVSREKYFNESGHSEEELESRINEETAIQIQTKLIMRSIGAREKIEISRDDVVGAVVEAAMREGKSPEAMMKKLSDGDGLRSIKNQCMERKILHFLLENAEIEEC